ncbi:kinase domain protein (macronuclear) [Tetrahymena thermophila SB210]|uniref:Kinase domain protein n=1 Tax=Tetrahymena thermophila (strain SB210) TaxID=312017 RepID=W7XCM4_TETTS|nr:kinase domain protein [Tetrahymena thermophila SB210]EWS71526.1 kinase domain protein [Tetrahymena thermophila SB210]|eukprot:XP_012655937.1 kinase domain protein [Tetrahymena thermophila SB210]
MIIKKLSQVELLKNQDLEWLLIDLRKEHLIIEEYLTELSKYFAKQPQALQSLKLYFGEIAQVNQLIACKISQGIINAKNLKEIIVDLNGISVGDEAIFNLTFAFSQCRFLTNLQLNFKNAQIGWYGSQQLGKALSQCQNLTNLNLQLKNNNLDSSSIQEISQSFELCKNIQLLNLYLQANNFQQEGASNLAQSIQKCPGIRFLTLFIQSNYINDEGAYRIGQAISQLKNLEHILLNMKWSNIGDVGVTKIFQGLLECKKIADININLLSNRITNKGLTQLAELISSSQHLTNLKIDLRWNNFDVEGEFLIFKGISKSKSLKKVSTYLLQKNSEAYNLQQLNLGILKFETIEELLISMKGKEIESLGVSKITQGLLSFKNLKKLKLNLNQDDIDDQQLQSSSINLEKLYQIDQLSNKIENLGVESLFKAFQKLSHLNKLCIDLSFNKITLQGVDCIKGISQIQNLTFLKINLDKNQIKYVLYLNEAIKNCTRLKTLILSLKQTQIKDEDALNISKGLNDLNNLNYYELNLMDNSRINDMNIKRKIYEQCIRSKKLVQFQFLK